MKLIIDNREPSQIIKYIYALNNTNKINIEIKTLDIGDYIFYDEITERIKVIIERKSLSDLESSIKDGRYTEQSFRLNNSNVHNHNIIYLIEGNIQNYKKTNFKQTLYSSIFSLNYFKGFSVIISNNNIESGEIIYNFIIKLLKEGNKKSYYPDSYLDSYPDINPDINLNVNPDVNPGVNLNVNPDVNLDVNPDVNLENNSDNYLEYIKTSKKSNITTDNILDLMLMQIPGISSASARAIAGKYINMKNLIDSLKDCEEDFNNIKLSMVEE